MQEELERVREINRQTWDLESWTPNIDEAIKMAERIYESHYPWFSMRYVINTLKWFKLRGEHKDEDN